ncbi:50S ribosomal protein L13 [Candidatus Saccharibacteria bacterium RIFCSPHIGHO2_02_FULL_47_12]|nr:MAG: 50S ribosomal protein L13 [Candidatus Saccharibacteria bacterium RIFCSPHIGHO2_02_FULL_47_12]
MKTFSQKPADVTRKWYVIDASEATLGRVSTVVARLLIGKDKPTVTSHVDGGDFVIVVNAANLKVTGNKMLDKVYYRHSGHPGNLRARRLEEQMALNPTKVIEKAVYGMVPVNKLRDGRMKRLKIYAGAEHDHAAQKPEQLSLKESK